MNFGKWNFWLNRVLIAGNRIVQPINFLLLIYLTAMENPLVWFIIPGVVIGAITWFYFDTKKVVESEFEYMWNRNPMARRLVADVKEIKEALKK